MYINILFFENILNSFKFFHIYNKKFLNKSFILNYFQIQYLTLEHMSYLFFIFKITYIA